MKSSTARSKKMLEEDGWICWGVEQVIRIPGNPIPVRRDLFNIGDLICIRGYSTLVVQSTVGLNNAAKRVDKIRASKFFNQVAGAWFIEVHGWRKLKRPRLHWECKRITVS